MSAGRTARTVVVSYQPEREEPTVVLTTGSEAARSLRVERTVDAPPERVWALVADITRMGEWSPETTSAAWTHGAAGPSLGARFRGTNQKGSKTWHSDCVVTACEPGRRFAFHVSVGPFSVARWAYELEPTDDGCRVAEVWEDDRGVLVTWLSPMITGTRDRAARNAETMTVTLERLGAAAAASSPA